MFSQEFALHDGTAARGAPREPWQRLCRAAELVAFQRRRPPRVGHLVRTAGRRARHARRAAVPRRHRPARHVASRRARPRRAQRAGSSRAPAGARWRCPGWSPTTCFSRCSPTASFRSAISSARFDQLDYLDEPDLFHDIFGHVPMLSDPRMARMMEQIGRLGVAAIAAGEGDRIARIYWHSVEFGLCARRRARSRFSAPGWRRALANSPLRSTGQGSSGGRSRSRRRPPRLTTTTACNRSTSSTMA